MLLLFRKTKHYQYFFVEGRYAFFEKKNKQKKKKHEDKIGK